MDLSNRLRPRKTNKLNPNPWTMPINNMKLVILSKPLIYTTVFLNKDGVIEVNFLKAE